MMESLNDRFSIKNLLFNKAFPNYIIPIPTAGHKLFSCIDCGDKFIIESSYEHHINRKSVQISYQCRHCSQHKIFYNRCNFLAHIRSHAFKTATINVPDLKMEPLPLTFYAALPKTQQEKVSNKTFTSKVSCFECKKDVTDTGVLYKDRSKHYMQHTNETHSCPVCMFVLPTMCALKVHLRIHLKAPPYFCPECGINLPSKNVIYPYNHDCEGFKMMRATVRLKCPAAECPLFHPSVFSEHLKENHFKKVYKCVFCFVACFTEAIMIKHLKGHGADLKSTTVFFQCDLCPSRLIMQNQVENHLKYHSINYMHPCWACGKIFRLENELITHHKDAHGFPDILKSLLQTGKDVLDPKARKFYRVVKRCDQCKRSFTYKCKYGDIGHLPKECPYKCTPKSTSSSDTQQEHINCHLCKNKISQDWDDIKLHYAHHHKSYRCVDIKVVVEKLNLNSHTLGKKKQIQKTPTIANKRHSKGNRSRRTRPAPAPQFVNIECTPTIFKDLSEFACTKCDEEFETKESLEKHDISQGPLHGISMPGMW